MGEWSVKIGLYLRDSKEEQTTENQELVLREICEINGWEIHDTYADHGISGSRGRDKRPEFDRLIKDMVRRKFQKELLLGIKKERPKSLLDIGLTSNITNWFLTGFTPN